MSGETDREDPSKILVREDMILQGRNPDWRTAWLGGLGPEDRREVQRAVRQGRRVSAPRLAPFVFGIGSQWRRWSWLMFLALALQSVFVSLSIYFNCIGRFNDLGCTLYLIAAVLLLILPFVLRYRYKRLRQAEEANRQFLPQVTA